MAERLRFDALVVGSGIGGLCAGARLAHSGWRTLVVERLDRVGGRASTESIDGFLVNTGAIAIEYGGVMEETFHTVGAPFDIRVPKPAAVFRVRGRDVDISRGGWGMLLNGITRRGAAILHEFGAARNGVLPDAELSTKEWLNRYTRNQTVHGVVRNLCAAIFAANSDELPAKVFLTYFMQKGAFKDFGFCPSGTVGISSALSAVVERNGEVWLSSEVQRIRVDNGRVAGAVVRRSGRRVDVDCDVVVSNAGPRQTVELCGAASVPAEYRHRVENDLRPSANIVVNFASRRPLVRAPGIINFATTQRLCNMANLTATCPELAPPGWHLYVAYAVPMPAIGDFDEEREIALALQDLREQIKGFDDAWILSIRVMRGDWPAQRSCAGFDLPHETPIHGLWNVGDAVKQYASGGTQACAETAKLVVEAILRQPARSPAPGATRERSPPSQRRDAPACRPR